MLGKIEKLFSPNGGFNFNGDLPWDPKSKMGGIEWPLVFNQGDGQIQGLSKGASNASPRRRRTCFAGKSWVVHKYTLPKTNSQRPWK